MPKVPKVNELIDRKPHFDELLEIVPPRWD